MRLDTVFTLGHLLILIQWTCPGEAQLENGKFESVFQL